jgi:putative nucleotidyltransferase with HDIG domain
MTAIGSFDDNQDWLLARVVELLRDMGAAAYLVGGAVRDRLLDSDRPTCDLDFAVAGDGLTIARRVADALGAAFYALDAGRGVGRVVLSASPSGQPGSLRVVDVARFQGPDLEADLAGRDFTINAMALDVSQDPPRLIDLHGGQADLHARRLRAVSRTAMHNDPVRGLRAVRLAAQLGFEIEPPTRALIHAAAPGLAGTSAERLQEELVKILSTPGLVGSLRDLDDMELLVHVLPEVTALQGLAQSRPHRWDAHEHTLQAVAALEELLPIDGSAPHPDVPFPAQVADHLDQTVTGGQSRRTLLTLAALLHDVGKPATASLGPDGRTHFLDHDRVGAELATAALRRLRFAGDAVRLVESLVRHHLRPLQLAWGGGASRRAVHRYFRATGEAGVEVALLALADQRATKGPTAPDDQYPILLTVVHDLLEAYFQRQPTVVAPRPLLSGRDLKRQFGLPQGPAIGRLLDDLREAQAIGEVATRAQAEDWIKERIREWNLETGD